MVVGGTIARVDVFESGVLTAAGVGVGSTEGEVMAAYGPALEVSGHRYTWASGGHYLVVEPRSGRKLVFETNRADIRIIRVRSFDVATFVAFGAAEIGIAGHDVLLEFDFSELYAPVDLGIGHLRSCFCHPDRECLD